MDDHNKINKLDIYERMLDAESKAENHHKLYLRAMADIENIKKRHSKEKELLESSANESLIKDLLVVVDNLDRSIKAFDDTDNIESMKEGISLTKQTLIKTLERFGVKEIKSLNTQFDPNFHEALFELIDSSKEPGIIIEEMQRGYTLNDKLIRPSKVVVNKNR